MSRLLCVAGFLTLIASSLQINDKSNASSYTAAVVEYYQQSPLLNVQRYREIIEYASTKAVDIIVFPEHELPDKATRKINLQRYRRATLLKDYYHYDYKSRRSCLLPDSMEVALCDDKEDKHNEILKEISCAAKIHKIYTVVNFFEHSCDGSASEFYKIIVVFDREGRLVAKHRQYNFPNYIDNFNRGSGKPVSFTTDFNVTFGLLISTDVLDQRLTYDFIESDNINNFVVSSRYTQLPYCSLTQFVRGLAYTTNVNLLEASNGYNNYLGSGIYVGKAGPAHSHHALEKLSNAVIIAKVPLKPDELTELTSSMHLFNEMAVDAADRYYATTCDDNGRNENIVTPIEKHFNKTICLGDVCCDFDIKYNENFKREKESERDYRFLTVVKKKIFGLSNNYTFEVCSLMSCSNDGITRYVSRTNEPLLKYVKISRSVKNNKLKRYVPILGSETRKSFSYETISMVNDTARIIMTLSSPRNNFESFGIYGTSIAQENEIPEADKIMTSINNNTLIKQWLIKNKIFVETAGLLLLFIAILFFIKAIDKVGAKYFQVGTPEARSVNREVQIRDNTEENRGYSERSVV